jgi:hypothetical protein
VDQGENVLKRDLGDVLVVPVLPLVSREVENTTMVRSLMEFMLYRSMQWGSLPTCLRQVDEHEEEVWVGKIVTAMRDEHLTCYVSGLEEDTGGGEVVRGEQ